MHSIVLVGALGNKGDFAIPLGMGEPGSRSGLGLLSGGRGLGGAIALFRTAVGEGKSP
jgi:hypothetical protein